MNNNENKQSSESQNAKILSWLENGNKITALEALQLFGCFRLASRVHDLRERGHNIMKEMIIQPNGKRVAQYSLPL
jgi:beta-lactamase class D